MPGMFGLRILAHIPLQVGGLRPRRLRRRQLGRRSDNLGTGDAADGRVVVRLVGGPGREAGAGAVGLGGVEGRVVLRFGWW